MARHQFGASSVDIEIFSKKGFKTHYMPYAVNHAMFRSEVYADIRADFNLLANSPSVRPAASGWCFTSSVHS